MPKNVAKMVKSRLLDQYLQTWNAELQTSSKGKHHALFKENVNSENYLTQLHGSNLLFLVCLNLERAIINSRFADRKCELWEKNDIGDNFHYILECPFFEIQRKQYSTARACFACSRCGMGGRYDFFIFFNVLSFGRRLNMTEIL